MADYRGIKGGCSYKFVDTPPNDVICQICHYPSREPYLSVCCKRVFCKSCLAAQPSSSVLYSFDALSKVCTRICPSCRSADFRSYPSKRIEELINHKVGNLHVLCVHYQKGCQWKGEINAIRSHLGHDCQYQEIFCPNNCGELVLRLNIPNHIEHECECRIVECEYCHLKADHHSISSKHLNECPKLPVACPNKCTDDSILREDLKVHEKMCPLAQVKCMYYEMGCTTLMSRKEEKTHNKVNDKDHFNLVKRYRNTVKFQIAEKESQLALMNEKLSQMKRVLAKTEDELTKARSQTETMKIVHQDSIINTELKLAFVQEKLSNSSKNFENSQLVLDKARKDLTKMKQRLAQEMSTTEELTSKLSDTQCALKNTEEKLADNKWKLKTIQRSTKKSQIGIASKFVDGLETGMQLSEMAMILCSFIMAVLAGYVGVVGLLFGICLFLTFILLYCIIKTCLVYFSWLFPKVDRLYVDTKKHLITRLQNHGSVKIASILQTCFFCSSSNAAEEMKKIMEDAI